MAEREGFEPPRRFPARSLSRRVLSAGLSHLSLRSILSHTVFPMKPTMHDNMQITHILRNSTYGTISQTIRKDALRSRASYSCVTLPSSVASVIPTNEGTSASSARTKMGGAAESLTLTRAV